MKEDGAPERMPNRSLGDLFLEDPYLSPTMKARLLHEKLSGGAYEEEFLQELLALSEEEDSSKPIPGELASIKVEKTDPDSAANLQDSEKRLPPTRRSQKRKSL